MSNENHLGGTYIKTGTLKANRDGSARQVRCTIDGRKGGPRILPARENQHGKFGPALEIPTSIEGQDFILSLPADKGDGQVLQQVFGPVGETWIGKAVLVFESEVLDRVRVQPIG